jgi:hypothetical protein
MTVYQSVLAFGDSHVAGCELSADTYLYLTGNVTLEHADAAGKLLAFPQIVADKLNVPCYNYALSGGSNDRSMRLLVQAVQEHPDSLVLFGYTCTDRTEFYYPDKGNFLGRDKDNFVQVGLPWKDFTKDVPLEHHINDIYIEKILRPYNNLDQTIFLVDAVCSLHAKKVVHLPLTSEKITRTDKMFDFEKCNSYVEWCTQKKFKQLPYLHYDQDAHKELAKLILEKL